MKWIKRWFKLSPVEWVMLVLAYRWLLWARWQMHSGRLGGRELLEGDRMARISGAPQLIDADDPRIQRRVRLINLAARYPCRWSWCLQSSLALREWLAQGGVFGILRTGVQKRDGQFVAHAWLEYQGKILNDNDQVVGTYISLQTDQGKLLKRIADANPDTVRDTVD